MIIDSNIMREHEGKTIATELVRCMIAISTDFTSANGELEIDRSPYTALLNQVLQVVNSRQLSQESVIKLVHRCNHGLFTLADVTM